MQVADSDHDDFQLLSEAVFSPLDAPYSPYSSGYYSTTSASDSGTHIMSPGQEETNQNMYTISEADEDPNKSIERVETDSLDGFGGWGGELDYEPHPDELSFGVDYSNDYHNQQNYGGNGDLNGSRHGYHYELQPPVAPGLRQLDHVDYHPSTSDLTIRELHEMKTDQQLMADVYGEHEYQDASAHNQYNPSMGIVDSQHQNNGLLPVHQNSAYEHHNVHLKQEIPDEHVHDSLFDESLAQLLKEEDPALRNNNAQQRPDAVLEIPWEANSSPDQFSNVAQAESGPSLRSQTNERYHVSLRTEFHKKYWRNDRKNIQCFPICPEFGDYYLVRVKDLKHKVGGGGTCSSTVNAAIDGDGVGKMDIIALSRINLATEDGKTTDLKSEMCLSTSEFNSLKAHCLLGKTSVESDNRISISFFASCWKLTFELSKKRRPKDMPNLAPKYSFEVICAIKEGESFRILSNAVSAFFQIASTRTLAREIEAMQKGGSQEAGQARTQKKRPAVAEQAELNNHSDELYIEDPTIDNRYKKMRQDDPNYRAQPPISSGSVAKVKSESNATVPDKTKENHREDDRGPGSIEPLPSPGPIPQLPMNGEATQYQNRQLQSESLPSPRRTPLVEDTSTFESAPNVIEESEVDGQSIPIHPIIVEDIVEPPPMYQLSTAYTYGVFLGLFGGHHFYLGRYGWGVLYALTFGLGLVGWVYDLVRMPYLVNRMNTESSRDCTLGETYIVWLVLGILGGHRYAIGQFAWGIYYTLTFGCLGIGWIVDLTRLSSLYRDRESFSNGDVFLTDAYLSWFPGGLVGIHYLYLGDYWKFALYLLTFGLFGIGWIVDGFRLPKLVSEKQTQIESERHATVNREEAGIEMPSVAI